MKLRKLTSAQGPNDGRRHLIEAILVPEVIEALQDWMAQVKNGVLIGGLALSHWVKPRYTQDIDVLFVNEGSIPEKVEGFKKTRDHCFQHNLTHVEVEVLTPEFLKLPGRVVKAIIDTAILDQGVKIASPSGLVASKLFRYSLQDRADIRNLIDNHAISLNSFKLEDKQLSLYFQVMEEQ